MINYASQVLTRVLPLLSLVVVVWCAPHSLSAEEPWEKAYVKINFKGGRLDNEDKVIQRIERDFTIKPGVKYFELDLPLPTFGRGMKDSIFPHYPKERGIPIHAAVMREGGKEYFKLVATLAHDNPEGLNVDTRMVKLDFYISADTPSGEEVETTVTNADLGKKETELLIYLTLWSNVFEGDLNSKTSVRPQYTEGTVRATVTESPEGFRGQFSSKNFVADRSGKVAVEDVAEFSGEFFVPWETGAYKFKVFK